MKRHSYSYVVIVILMAVRVAPAQTANPSASEALRQWEGLEANMGNVVACAEAVRQGVPLGDAATIDRLITIAKNESQPGWSSSIALLVACELADSQNAPRLLDVAEAILSPGNGRKDFADREKALETSLRRSALLDRFVSKGVEHLLHVSEDHEGILVFLKGYYQGSLHGPGAKNVIPLMLACQVPQAFREEVFLAIVTAASSEGLGRRDGRWYPILLDELGPTSIPSLRKLVRWKASPDKLNHVALRSLAYLGDREIEPDLEAYRLQLNVSSTRDLGDFVVKQFQWLIDARNDPTMHLENIEGKERPATMASRVDSIRIAAKVGVDKTRIKSAIMKYAGIASPLQRQLYLPAIKREGLKQGILTESDFPDVKKSSGLEEALSH